MLCQKWGKYLSEYLNANNDEILLHVHVSTCTELHHQLCRLQWKCLFDVRADGDGDNDEDSDDEGDNNDDDGGDGDGDSDGDGDDDDQEGDGKKS